MLSDHWHAEDQKNIGANKHLLSNAGLYLEPRILGILFLGFSSGLPFLLTLATLHVWLTETGVTKSVIGLFAAVTIPYSLKFIWSPIIDHIKIPILSEALGHRKSWMLLSQSMLVISLIGLGRTDPLSHIWITALLASCVSFFSATQDICIEAYRVQKLPDHEIGIGASASHLGYRLGMWVSGAGALYLASSFSWSVVYAIMAGCMSIGIVTVLLSQEPLQDSVSDELFNQSSADKTTEKMRTFTIVRFLTWLTRVLTKGVTQTLSHLRHKGDLLTVLAFILLFKLVDTFLNAMTVPFLLEIGFDKLDIANVGKSFGIGAMILGGFFAGLVLTRFPLRQTILVCCGLQLASAIAFYGQSLVGNNIFVLLFSIGLDNFANGMSFAAFIAYLSVISKGRHAATHFAFLTSIASFGRVLFSYIAGICAEALPWDMYYMLTAFLTIPVMFVVVKRIKVLPIPKVIQ